MAKPLTYTQEEFVASKIDLFGDNGCWIWTGRGQEYPVMDIGRDGRGATARPRTTRVVHRVLYEAWRGEVTEETLDHLCRNKYCVNPAHLEPVSRAENVRRAAPYRKRKTHCSHGHEMNENNTYWYGNYAKCRTCRAAEGRKSRATAKMVLR